MNRLERHRTNVYWLCGLGLTLFYMALRGTQWQGSAQLHTLMEVAATLLASLVGTLALVRFYARKDNTFLLIGTGFLGTAFLDGYHAVVTASFFKDLMPSDLPSLIPWSWIASRQFLSVMMLCSWLAWCHEQRHGVQGRINAHTSYLLSALFTLSSFLFFTLVPLPRAYYPEWLFHRPEEFAPALFFALALVGYLYKGAWRRETFDHWLILSLIMGLVSQTVFMSFSNQLFDFEFDAAHTLKKASYLCVLTGLLINIYAIYHKEEEHRKYLKSVVDNIVDGIITIDSRGIIQAVNPALLTLFGYQPQQLLQHNMDILLPEPEKSHHAHHLRHYHKTKVSNIMGSGRELKAIKQNGDVFPIHLQVAEFAINGENIILGIIRDITQQKEVEKEKSEFISTVSHELRTPLTSIRASLGMLASGSMGALPEKASRLTTIAKQNTERLIILVNDILDIEKLQAGKIAFQFKGLILADLVSACLQVNQSLAEKYAIRFELQAGHDKTCVMADQSRLMQVVNNLLSNAAKYSPAGGVVTIAISHTEQRVRVTVMDRGPGVPNAFRKQIFGRFKQADSSDTRKVGGTGLGLSISQSIIQRHGGHMGFDSIEGEGASFYFELAAKPDAAPHAHDETQQISVPTPSAPRILLVGDDAAVARLLSEMLQQAGFATDTAHTARQARQYLMHTHYDAMTVDIMLPDQDGISLIRDIRLQEKTRHLATVVIAAKAQPARQQVHLSCLGIVDWIEKPFNKALLIDAIKLALQPAKASKKQLQDVSLAASLLKSNIRKNLIRLDSLGTST